MARRGSQWRREHPQDNQYTPLKGLRNHGKAMGRNDATVSLLKDEESFLQILDKNHAQPLCLFLLVQTKMIWHSLLTVWYSRQPLGIEVQGCPVLR